MRIVAGEFRSRRLHTPGDASVTRPYPDRVKVSLFDLLRGQFEGARVLDAFCGVGTLGLEAVSRGASYCVFVERDKGVAALLQRNIQELGVTDRCEVLIGDALGAGALARCPDPVDVVFLDPPYALVEDPDGWNRVRAHIDRVKDRLRPGGFLIVRTPWPFFLRPASPAAPPDVRPRRRKPHRKSERWVEVRPEDLDEDGQYIADEDESPPESAGTPSVERAPRVWGDLRLPGLEGPETHVYHATAVHLYMRPRGAPPSP